MADHEQVDQLRSRAMRAWWRKVGTSSDLARTRRAMHAELNASDERPDPGVSITRRTFIHRSMLAGAAGATAAGWFPMVSTIDIAHGQQAPFRFAWVSDNHLYPKDVNTRFVEKTVRAVKEVQAMSPAADFMIHGGDLAQLGAPVELDLGADILKEVTIRKVFIPGEHDWYLDMGQKWMALFGQPNWTFDHKGVRFVGLDTVTRGPDYWTAKKMTPAERMGHMATLDGSVAGAWAGVGRDQLEWLNRTLSGWSKDQPIVIFSHNPLYEYYPPWNFWVRDWREVHEVLKPYNSVTNVHGHTHQVLYNEIGKMRSIGMLATSWPWPYAPEGVPALTRCMVRADPGDHFDGLGWAQLSVGGGRVENEYMMWRKKEHIFAEAAVDSGCGDNGNQILRPRVADQQWIYPGAYK
jgi:3',5'-cyclic-AMP phosphodiesterase